MSKPFNKMTKVELEKAAIALKLDNKVKESAKDPKAPTNAEYVTVLEEYKNAQDIVNSDTKAELDAEPKEEAKSIPKGKKATEEDKIALNKTAFNCIITDHDNSVKIEDDDPNRLFEFSLGNNIIGNTTYRVKVNGEAQYLDLGAIKHLRTIKTNKHTKNSKDMPIVKPIDRFKVTIVDGLTPEKLESLRKNQQGRLNI